MNDLSRALSLRFENFFNVNPGHWLPTSVGVAFSEMLTITDPESHAHLAFVDVVTVPLNMADAVKIFRPLSFPHVHNTVNWLGTWTFSTVESEIPAFAAPVTVVDSKSTSPVNMEGCIREVFGEHTILRKSNDKKETCIYYQLQFIRNGNVIFWILSRLISREFTNFFALVM